MSAHTQYSLDVLVDLGLAHGVSVKILADEVPEFVDISTCSCERHYPVSDYGVDPAVGSVQLTGFEPRHDFQVCAHRVFQMENCHSNSLSGQAKSVLVFRLQPRLERLGH
jgi:hypothetical protein